MFRAQRGRPGAAGVAGTDTSTAKGIETYEGVSVITRDKNGRWQEVPLLARGRFQTGRDSSRGADHAGDLSVPA